MDQAAAICQRIIDRISRLPERRRPHDSSLHQSLLAALILLAKIHAKQDDWPAVDDLCMRARTLLPVYAHRWAVEPFVLRIQYGRSQEGIDGLQALAESNHDSFYFWDMLAQKAWETGNNDLALTASDRAAQLATPNEDPGDMASHHIVRFELFNERGEWQQAVHEWDMACVWDTEMKNLREVVVRMFLEAGLYDEALEHVKDEWLTDIMADYYRAWIAQQRGDMVRARHLWRKVAESDPDDYKMDSPTLRAFSHCWLRQPDAALAVLLEQVAGSGVMHAAQALALALAWAIHGDVEAAAANIKLAVKRSVTPLKPAPLLSALDWIDFEQLVQDEAIKGVLRSYFEAPRPKSP
jgi:tetratricopeptide (TPR) repeat protein